MQDFKAAERLSHVANLHRRHLLPSALSAPYGASRRCSVFGFAFRDAELVRIVRNSTILSNPLVALSIFVQLPELL
jgi:hypothetical protein